MKGSTLIFLSVLFFAVLSVGVSYTAADDDPCSANGIIVRNATMLDLWYKKSNGACSILIHEHLFAIRPGESVTLYSDMECRTLYCPENPSYKEYKSLDANGNCEVRILPNCNLSDM
jgi:hypothetical protein